jgi:hypothetical protein
MLTDIEPWQDQVEREIKKLEKHTYRKDAEIGYEIRNGFAELTLLIK